MSVVTLTDAWPKPGEPYREVAQDVPFRAVRPFPVKVVPSRLVAKLRTR